MQEIEKKEQEQEKEQVRSGKGHNYHNHAPSSTPEEFLPKKEKKVFGNFNTDDDREKDTLSLREGFSFSYLTKSLSGPEHLNTLVVEKGLKGENLTEREREVKNQSVSDKLENIFPYWRNNKLVGFLKLMNDYQHVIDVMDQEVFFSVSDLLVACQEEYEEKISRGYKQSEIKDLRRSLVSYSKLCKKMHNFGLLEVKIIKTNLPQPAHVYYNPDAFTPELLAYVLSRREEFYLKQEEATKKKPEELREEAKERVKAQKIGSYEGKKEAEEEIKELAKKELEQREEQQTRRRKKVLLPVSEHKEEKKSFHTSNLRREKTSLHINTHEEEKTTKKIAYEEKYYCEGELCNNREVTIKEIVDYLGFEAYRSGLRKCPFCDSDLRREIIEKEKLPKTEKKFFGKNANKGEEE